MSSFRFVPERKDWLEAAGVAVALFALYALTAPRTVSLEDDGLFVLSSYFLGIEHPPGYPLFTVIGHLFSQLPFGSVAYRVHLASALFGALSGAVLWLCARSVVAGRIPAYLAALGLCGSPVFWSQAVIAEVYTLNTFFFLVLVYLGLRACPLGSDTPSPRTPWILAAMAFLFGLSLSNHWPLMLLVAPAFVVLLWPARQHIVQRFGLLLALVVLGLVPYGWMVWRSWRALPISFDGPLETLPEIWFFISRAGYAGIDQSASATWLDHVKFLEYQFGQLFVQFAVAGTAVLLIGSAMQWRTLGRRLSVFLTVAFLMPSAVLLLLLGFDYDSIHKHIYHVYPLPSYAVAAFWMALGFAWLRNRYAIRVAPAGGAAALIVALIFAVGTNYNVFDDDEWGARYAQAILKTLPPDAVVFGQGDADLAPMAYFHMIENWRPDITLYQSKGLVLGNRLFLPLRADLATANRAVSEMIEAQTAPVAFTLDAYTGYARRDRWLYTLIDRSSRDPNKVTVDIPDEARRFYEESIANESESNAWIAYFQGQMRQHYAQLIGRQLVIGRDPDARTRADIVALTKDYYGALGLAEGMMFNPDGYVAGDVAALLERARDTMPSDVPKEHLSQFFYIRGALRANSGDLRGGLADLETAVSVWPVQQNKASVALKDLYRKSGDKQALAAFEEREKHFKPLPRY